MIDIKLLRENPDLIRASQTGRGEDASIVDQHIQFTRNGLNCAQNLTFFSNIDFQKSNRFSFFLKFFFHLLSKEGIGVNKEDRTPLACEFSDKSKPNSTCSTSDKNGFIFHLLEILGLALLF